MTVFSFFDRAPAFVYTLGYTLYETGGAKTLRNSPSRVAAAVEEGSIADPDWRVPLSLFLSLSTWLSQGYVSLSFLQLSLLLSILLSSTKGRWNPASKSSSENVVPSRASFWEQLSADARSLLESAAVSVRTEWICV